MRRSLALLALACLLAAPAHAETAGDAIAWLQRIANAARRLDFTGTFIYQSGGSSETSRITHVVDASGEHEKLEVLDGSPREVLRSNDEVRCILPEDKVVIVERRRPYKVFPDLLPASVGSLAESYRIRKGEATRVAGFNSQQIILEPKDDLRYGHVLWAEARSGLLLKARMVDERNEPIEQFAFTQLQIGGPIDREALKPKSAGRGGEWRVLHARTAQTPAPGEWVFKTQLPGFRKSAGMKRQGSRAGVETTHFVFSDGLASISVFIEPLGERSEAVESGTYAVGALNVYKRVVRDHLVTVLGEVPPITLKSLGEGIDARKR